MHMDPIMPTLVGVVAAMVLIGLVMRHLRQPQVVGYLVAGAVLGPSGMGVVEDTETVARFGAIGVVLLLFFAGMEIELPKLMQRWRIPVLGTGLQILVSVGLTVTIGISSGWPLGRAVLLGFVISLSSTAVVMKLLHERGPAVDSIGTDVVGILLAQDIAIIPMLVVVGAFAGDTPDPVTIAAQVVGGAAVVGLLFYLARAPKLRLPFGDALRSDHELQVFAAFLIAFGFALLTGVAGLSTALGAFVAGLLVGAAHETEWVTKALHPFHVLLLALFFVSIGMLLDLAFLVEHAPMIAALVAAVLVLNTVINAGALRTLGLRWPDALYGATMLAQIGGFSFVWAGVGQTSGMFTEYGYRVTIAVIAITLCVSPLWIWLGRRVRARYPEAG